MPLNYVGAWAKQEKQEKIAKEKPSAMLTLALHQHDKKIHFLTVYS